MATPLLVSYDPASPSSGLSLKQIAYFGRVLVKVSSLAQAEDFLKRNFRLLDVYVDATAITSTGDLVDILNAGAAKIFISLNQLTALSQEQSVPSSRLVVYAAESQVDAFKTWVGESTEHKDAGLSTDSSAVKAIAEKLGMNLEAQNLYRTYTSIPTEETLKDTLAQGGVSVVSADALTFEHKEPNGKIVAASLIAARAVADQSNGLYATTVTDERGTCLGLVWSNDESIAEALRTGTGVYQSRKRGLWYKGQSSGDVQELIRVGFDCDSDCLVFVVNQIGRGFCHLGTASCFGPYNGLARLQKTLQARKADAPAGSYTARLFNEPKLTQAKIMEEADELCRANTKEEIAFEAADLLYFALTRCVAAGVSLEDVERNLDLKSLKVKRRKGDAKGPWAEKAGLAESKPAPEPAKPAEPAPKADEPMQMTRVVTASTPENVVQDYLKRPSQKSNDAIVALVRPIIDDVRKNGDAGVLKYTHKFEKATSLTSPVLSAPFPPELMKLSPETQEAIDVSISNIAKFHSAQKDSNEGLKVETMPGVVCSRFSRPIERVGLYIPGGTAVLPSTAMMLGVPAMVAGCKKLVFASPPRADGSISPEIVYVAHKVGAESIVLAGGAQAVAAMAYGTESVSKVDKILGPGNQFVTAAKMLVANDTSAGVSIDMPAGPSEVLVIADKDANPAFVASDLLSQAEHGVDSQVILIAIDLNEEQLQAIEKEVDVQAKALPRVDIVKGSLAHSVTFVVRDLEEAMALSNDYAPEHLILQIQNAEAAVEKVQNAGSVFIGQWTPESVGDYSAGVNHSLPTYGYAKQYSGVNLGSFLKHITSSNLTADGLLGLSRTVEQLAAVEGLDAHKRAVSIRVAHMKKQQA
ncbi:histidine biosynthesis protein HIS4 [Aspergillus luchuensis]|uniref:Histidine biosynthesis trifunctional protein n=2 Tax=Aspergillus subgen. Circumdati TaxID=2720871 RepID=A0A146FB97_ASPKA|nr:histidinol dehydrogenase [Aspergillus piperis CBS 112811]XP_041537078.1 trifunctional histidinol dehydrogenase [Aspergillus luchuensis]GAA86700.1 histidinol dehydrogenase [Aspergillus luchuensis IFO 4308]RAH60090.1 histidinol dehydrogenase [Aspergillus piperis CBS 112811]BCR93312.1 trifunctional histidinol dehydrogenase [Aspergillus luchuensis]BCS05958.1 trifunctional histidinol dehydrogenase [Aspergillus luchuensis]GAT23196.1 histidinol dehydrogenase [Aspergillus luchuensis]